MLPVTRFGTMALPCHSNQYIAHYAMRGGSSNISYNCGAFYFALNYAAFGVNWIVGAALSFKLILLIMLDMVVARTLVPIVGFSVLV